MIKFEFELTDAEYICMLRCFEAALIKESTLQHSAEGCKQILVNNPHLLKFQQIEKLREKILTNSKKL